MNTYILNHPQLGPIEGIPIDNDLIQFRGIPYASIPQRFARSQLSTSRLTPPNHSLPFDATKVGASSIQPLNSAKTDATGNQLPQDGLEDEPQSEDCLNLTITLPRSSLPSSSSSSSSSSAPPAKLPILIFLHGGAFFIGAGTRAYYTPFSLLRTALHDLRTPLIFVSANYRLGPLGFFHSPSAKGPSGELLVPPNNGLHDQLRALEWVHRSAGGFGGDIENVTLLGQSAGGESTSLHCASGLGRGLYRRAIMFSGTSVTMPAKTPSEHEANFLSQARALGIRVDGRSSSDVARDMIALPVEKIRDLGWVGAPCTSSDALPDERASMRVNREGRGRGRERMDEWLESQVVSSAGYDGSISYIMTANDPQRSEHAKAIRKIAFEVLERENAEELMDIYGIKEAGEESEEEALEKICRFESDIGFFAASLSVAVGSAKGKEKEGMKKERGTETYFQIFDVGNPFEGMLEKGRFASHTWDVVALLGAYDEKVKKIEEESTDPQYKPYSTILEWRKKLITYVVNGKAPWTAYRSKTFTEERANGQLDLEGKKDAGVAMVVKNDGMQEEPENEYLGADNARRKRLLALAERQAGPDGWDVLWTDVCRRFLMAGK